MAIIVREKSFYKTLLILAFPIVMQNLITFGVGFADNLMVGTLGENAISGVFMGNQIQTLLQLFVLGIVSAMQIISTQYWGKRDTGSIKIIVAIAFRFTMIVTITLMILALFFPRWVLSLFTNDSMVIAEGIKYLRYASLSYIFFGLTQVLFSAMRSVETVKISMYVSIFTLVTHILLNWVLIFGFLWIPAMGVEGAAVSTAISRVFEAIIMVYYVLVIDKKLRLKLKDVFLRDKQLFWDYFRFGVPVIAGQVVWAVNNLSQGAIIGRLGTEVIAAVSITNMLYRLVFIWALGVSAAVAIITGKTVGAGEFEKMKLYAKTVQVMFLGIGILSGLVIFLLKDPFLMMYNISGDTLVVGRQFMTILSITMIGTCYQGTGLGGLVKAGGDTSFVFINDTIFVFLIVLPSALIAMNVFHAAPWVVFACLKCDEILKCFVAVVKINRFKWMKNLTRQREPELETAAAE